MLSSRKDEFQVCEKTVYRYINQDLFRQHPGRAELPKAPGMRPRRKKGRELKIDSKCRQGRSLDDFQNFCRNNKNPNVVEMDSVIGVRGGKVLLTMNFNNCTFLLAFIRNCNNSKSVINIFDHLERLLGTEGFKKLFPVILTDNGSEFSNPEALEKSCLANGKRTRIFYCDPYSSWQKGHVENNHENLRKIFPKGKSLNCFSQEQINIAVSHLNSFARASLNDVPAIKLFEQIYGTSFLNKMGIRFIEPDDVCLTPDLINR
jgi:IS30 family transposase